MADGVVYLTSADVSIPAGNADKPGHAEVGAQAEKAGTAANREPGTFTGQVADMPGVYFGNPGAAIAGGTDVLIKVVTDQDLATARDAAIATMNQSAQTFQLQDGRIVIPSTVQPAGEPSVQTDHTTGEQVDAFNVSGQETYQALTINPADLPDQMQADLRGQLVTQVPSGFALTDEPIAFASPVEQAAGSGLMNVAVTVDAAAQISPDLIDQIRHVASGKSQPEARQAIGTIEGVEVIDITVSPALFDKTLPGSGKIDVKAE
jgi:hypothetical protein